MNSFNSFGVARLTTRMLVAALFSTPLWANTYIVDAAGGGQFTDIQSAIIASQPGDVILVHAGNYAGFTLDKGVVIVGYVPATVSGMVSVMNIPASQRAAIVDLLPPSVLVSGCAGVVVLQGFASPGRVDISQCNDVRMADMIVSAGPQQLPDAVVSDSSRVEIVDSTIEGFARQNGGRGIVMSNGRAHAARSTFLGQNGADSFTQGVSAGDGGYGISMTAPCELFLVGPSSFVTGGDGGTAWWQGGGECWASGYGACAVQGGGSVHVDAGTTLHGGLQDNQFHCVGGPYNVSGVCATSEIVVAPPDPSLRLTGTPSAGATVAFTVYGEPGASAVLNLGRNMILVATPGVDIERLAPANRVIPLGMISGSGSITRSVLLPASFTPGLLFVAQAEVTGTNGLRRTNSTPIVVR